MAPPTSVIPDDYLAAIGHVANMTANLEFHIDLGIWELIGAPQQLTACVTAQMISAHPRLKAFIGLAELLGASAETIRALKSFQGDIGELVEKRNRLVHDPRMVHKKTGEIGRLQITAKPKVHFGFVHESATEVNDTANEIGAKVLEFARLREKTIAELAPLREKSLSQLKEIAPHSAQGDQPTAP
jgi:hypothetical protein